MTFLRAQARSGAGPRDTALNTGWVLARSGGLAGSGWDSSGQQRGGQHGGRHSAQHRVRVRSQREEGVPAALSQQVCQENTAGRSELSGQQVSFWPGRERLIKKGRGPRGPAAAPHSPGTVVGLGTRPGAATWRAASSSPTPGGGAVLEQSFPSPDPPVSSLHKPFQAFPASSSAPLDHPRPGAAGKPLPRQPKPRPLIVESRPGGEGQADVALGRGVLMYNWGCQPLPTQSKMSRCKKQAVKNNDYF